METNNSNFIVLSKEESLVINGGDKFMSDLGESLGMIWSAIMGFGEGVNSGGYSYCKVGC
jgi:hypothetical protein